MSAASGARVAASKRVAGSVQKSLPPDISMRTGFVDSVIDTSFVEVIISGSTLVLPYLNSYVPTEDDVVQVLKMGSTWLVLGKVGT